MSKDYYSILGVSRNSTDDEIKRAYRRLAHMYHPDKHASEGDKEEAGEKFKEINAAYEVLKNPSRRAQYDRFGQAGAGADFGGAADFGGDFGDFFGDMFSEFFGGRRRPGPEAGADLRYDLTVSFTEAAFGTTKKIIIPKVAHCKTCQGLGARPGTSPKRCGRCGGSGQERFQQGIFRIAKTCPECRGAGAVIENPCAECRGAGAVKIEHSLTLNIPGGVDTGSKLRVAGEGASGTRGGPEGDLYVFISVEPHPIFRREEDDVICEVPISFPQAALGTEIEVPTLEGPVKLKIPPGTQPGKIFRLKAKGVASPGAPRRGDHLVYIRIETPAKLNMRQKELIEEFARISNDDVFPHKKSFLDKVKEMFG
ncbi:MAG: molecular chaperone DnaJ [Deltaproteobacteria bacterium]|nr:molecular chaperone DnaJ [Deltaproteobacteria bacterium]